MGYRSSAPPALGAFSCVILPELRGKHVSYGVDELRHLVRDHAEVRALPHEHRDPARLRCS